MNVAGRIPGLRQKITEAIANHNQAHPGSSTRVRRLAFLDEPPSIDGNELSDKGTVNQAIAMHRRADDVERLYAKAPDADVIVFQSSLKC